MEPSDECLIFFTSFIRFSRGKDGGVPWTARPRGKQQVSWTFHFYGVKNHRIRVPADEQGHIYFSHFISMVKVAMMEVSS